MKGSETVLRRMLDAETHEGRLHLVGIAFSYAVGTTELSGRRVAERARYLRLEHAETDSDLLRRLNPPRPGGQS